MNQDENHNNITNLKKQVKTKSSLVVRNSNGVNVVIFIALYQMKHIKHTFIEIADIFNEEEEDKKKTTHESF